MQLSANEFEILLVEDNPADAELTREMFLSNGTAVGVTVMADAGSAMQLLQLRLAAEDEQPNLIILDLNLPGISGLEFLAELRANPRMRSLPVVIFTTSSSQADVTNSYALGANSYVTKPFDIDDCRAVVGALRKFWLTTASLPGRERIGGNA